MSNHMKWWGWGSPEQQFPLNEKPDLWTFIVAATGVDPDLNRIPHSPVHLEEICLPKVKQNYAFLEAVQVPLLSTHYERLIHTYGKSYRDLWRIRNGIVAQAPDYVCYPTSEEQVIHLLQLADLHNVAIIPFGGGSNIAGCLEARDAEERMILSVDMQRMNRVLHIDRESQIVRVEAGAMGPDLEKTLNLSGMTLGHFPDSFQFSSVGGWVATRSAGMQSDKYGKIEDMVIALRLVTPQGKIITRTVPKSSNGIDLKHICIGSEGILGIITEITLQIHPLPKKKEYYGYLFPDFESGVAAIYECVVKGVSPSMTRLNDATKTALSFAFKAKGSSFDQFLSKLMKGYLTRIQKMDLNRVCLLLVCYEKDQKAADRIYKKWGAVSLGTGPGKSFEKSKYDFPYLRDCLMDRGMIADASDTMFVLKE